MSSNYLQFKLIVKFLFKVKHAAKKAMADEKTTSSGSKKRTIAKESESEEEEDETEEDVNALLSEAMLDDDVGLEGLETTELVLQNPNSEKLYS